MLPPGRGDDVNPENLQDTRGLRGTEHAYMRPPLTWLIRAVYSVVLAVLLLAMAEALLRLVGQGNSTSFLVRRDTETGRWYASNRAFYQQFFNLPLGAIIHWDDLEFAFPERKVPGTFRVFVFGGSAANGTPPDTAVSFWRVLEAMLEEQFPERRFEFCCVASPGANSHVMAAAARACARHDPDLFLICMGNNEFIGPYGAGSSITSAYQPSMARIRLQLAIRGLFLYQFLEGATRYRELEARVVTPADVWRYLAPIDPEGDAARHVRANFETNLREMIVLGKNAGAEVIVLPPLANLKDWPPLVSVLGRNLDRDARARWKLLWREGLDRECAGDDAAALEAYRAAVAIDDRHAELCWRLGRLLARRGELPEARRWLARARDRDWVISRAPSSILDASRRVARETGALYIDQLPGKDPETWIPGCEEVFDNVHPTFKGNWLLAEACYPHVTRLLEPSGAGHRTTRPDPASVRVRLAMTPGVEAEHCNAVTRKMTMWGSGPLNGVLKQIAERRESLTREATALGDDPEQALRKAFEQRQGDYYIGTRYFWLLVNRGKTEEAERVLRSLVSSHPVKRGAQRAAAQFVLFRQGNQAGETALTSFLRHFPDDGAGWELLAGIRLASGDPAGTVHLARRALREDPTLNGARLLLARALEQAGQSDAALETCVEALSVDPEDQAVLEIMDRLMAAKNAADRGAFWAGIVRHNPGCWPARLRELEALREVGRDAPEAWSRLLEYARSRGPRAWMAQSTALRILDRREECLDALADAIRWNPDDFHPYEEVEQLLGADLPRRLQFWESLATDTRACRAWFHLGRAREAAGQVESALAAYANAVAQCPDDPAMQVSMGFASLNADRAEDALIHLRKAASLNPDIPGIGEAIQRAERGTQKPQP